MSVYDGMQVRWLKAVCFGAITLVQGGCALLVFDELSDSRSGSGGGSTKNGGEIVSGAQFGQTNDQIVQGVVIDGPHRVVMAGMTLGNSIQDVGCSATTKGGLDAFITWADPNDLKVECPTSRLLGGPLNDVPRAIAVNPASGGVGFTGFSTGDFDCGKGGLPNQGGRDIVVAAFVKDSCSWQQSFGGEGDQEAETIAFDSTGAAYIGGRFKGTLTFDQPPPAPATEFDGFIAKLSFDTGAPLWSVYAGGPGNQEVHALAIHAPDTIIVGGRFSQTLDLKCPESIPVLQAGHDALFIASLDGPTKTCKKFITIAEGPQEAEDSPISLAVAEDGDIFVAGGFRSRTLFPDQPPCNQVNTTQAEDVFVAKLNINGECQWSRRFGEVDSPLAQPQRAHAIAVDEASNVYVTGQFHGRVAFGETHVFQSLGDADAFVLKLDGAGEHVWSNVIASTGTESGNALVLDAAGGFVFVTGSFRDSPLNLAGKKLTPSGLDVFLAKFVR